MKIQNLQIAAGAASQPVASGACRLIFESFKETTGVATASFEITDGNAAGADVLLEITLQPNESTRDYWGRHGIKAESGIYFNLISGSVKGNLGVVTEHEYQNHGDQVVVLNFKQDSGM